MKGTKAGGRQTEAQRKAAEANLRKGNPNAFSKNPPREPAAADPPPKRTYRAKPSSEKRPAKPAAAPPAAPPAPAPAPAAGGQRSRGFLDDVLGAIFG